VSGEGVQDLGVSLGPGVIDRDASEAPFLAVACQLAIVAVHEKGVLGPGSRTLPWHEVLRHDIGGERRGIATDLDLEVGGGVARIERADERMNGVEDGLAPGDQGKIKMKLLISRTEVQDAILGQRGSKGLGVVVIEARGVAVKGIGDLVTVVRQLGKVGAHDNNIALSGVLLHVKSSSNDAQRSAIARGEMTFARSNQIKGQSTVAE